jgi:hypothetical protein
MPHYRDSREVEQEPLAAMPQVVARPVHPRIQKPTPLTVDKIKSGLISLGDSIEASREQFTADNASLDAFYARQAELRSEVAELQRQLKEKEDKLRELEAAGSPRDQFASAVVKAERDVMGLGGALLASLSEEASQRIYGISFEELSSKEARRDVQARYRKTLGFLQSQFYLKLGRESATATAEQVEARAAELLDDVSALLDSEYLADLK